MEDIQELAKSLYKYCIIPEKYINKDVYMKDLVGELIKVKNTWDEYRDNDPTPYQLIYHLRLSHCENKPVGIMITEIVTKFFDK